MPGAKRVRVPAANIIFYDGLALGFLQPVRARRGRTSVATVPAKTGLLSGRAPRRSNPSS